MVKKLPTSKGKNKKYQDSNFVEKKKSIFEPDYCAVKLSNDPWIVQPFEKYEEIRIETLRKKHKS